jgi:hypothetical protein
VSSYKEQLQSALVDAGWEHAESIEIDEWWADDCWKIRSVKQSWGMEVLISFLIDPQWDGAHSGERPPVWAIMATEDLPEAWNTEKRIALLSMSSRKFEPKLAEFVAALGAYRNSSSD